MDLLEASLPPLPRGPGAGRGFALARYKNEQAYCAIAVDAAVDDDATVRLLHTVIAADAGLVIDPDGLVNQLEGGFIQAASWALKEEVTWDADGVTSRDWSTYPILTFSEVPAIETVVAPRTLEPALGVGEASTAAAIANAICAATGIRVRSLPFTQAGLRAAAAQ